MVSYGMEAVGSIATSHIYPVCSHVHGMQHCCIMYWDHLSGNITQLKLLSWDCLIPMELS